MTKTSADTEARTVFASATRQKADVLFSSEEPLEGSAMLAAGPAEVMGYSVAAFLAITDRPLRIRVEEACAEEGPWAVTATLSSSFDPASQLERVCARVAPCGSFMRVFLDNLSASPEGILRFCALGLPEGDVP